jgi:hypothetical protein
LPDERIINGARKTSWRDRLWPGVAEEHPGGKAGLLNRLRVGLPFGKKKGASVKGYTGTFGTFDITRLPPLLGFDNIQTGRADEHVIDIELVERNIVKHSKAECEQLVELFARPAVLP